MYDLFSILVKILFFLLLSLKISIEFHPTWGIFLTLSLLNFKTLPPITLSPLVLSNSRLLENKSCKPKQMPINDLPDFINSIIDSNRPKFLRCLIASGYAPTPGSIATS